MKETQQIEIFKALADPTRLRLIRQLAACPTGQKTCAELSEKVDLSQPAMSHHFTKLANAGVITVSKSGTQKIYSLNQELLGSHGINIKKL